MPLVPVKDRRAFVVHAETGARIRLAFQRDELREVEVFGD
jgi:hypothetical protein